MIQLRKNHMEEMQGQGIDGGKSMGFPKPFEGGYPSSSSIFTKPEVYQILLFKSFDRAKSPPTSPLPWSVKLSSSTE